MDKFIGKYRKLINFCLYSLCVTFVLLIVLLSMKTSPFWLKLLKDIWHTLIPFLIAFLLAYLIHPLISFIESLKLPRGISILLFYFIIFGSLYALISWFLPTIFLEIRGLISNIPDYLESIQEQILILDIKFNLNLSDTITAEYENIMNHFSEHVQNIVGLTFNFLSSMVGSFISIIIVPIALFYFLKDYEKILSLFVFLVPKKYKHHAVSFGELLDQSLGSYLRGLLLVMLCLSFIGTFLFMFAGIEYSLLFGFLVGFTDFIPFIGPIIGAIPVVFYALSISWNKVITVILIVAILQFIEANILQPLIIGRNLDLHPLLVMVAVLLAGAIFGFQGVILAFPIIIIIKCMISYRRLLKEKD
ncbi:MAG TPA: AI-2E family transporter [Firmicutes bacterium]|nr:AI-2E family transporter [Bacillota bacterium]